VRPFWSEYSYFIEAVKIEKLSITLILQLIVVVAVFNIIAFVIYIMEKKSLLKFSTVLQNKKRFLWIYCLRVMIIQPGLGWKKPDGTKFGLLMAKIYSA
jgi:hypothetical protein